MLAIYSSSATGKKPMSIPTDELRRRFENKYIPEPNTGCWLWLMSLYPNGYGHTNQGRKTAYAHRVSYELAGKIIPQGLVLDHKCRIRSCVNPEHLEPCTNRENLLRGTGFPALNARKTHCKNGHPFTPANIRVGNGRRGRQCDICLRSESSLRASRRKLSFLTVRDKEAP